MPCPQLNIPQITLMPRCFDFPGAERIGRRYVEASIDLERTQPLFPWEQIDNSKPIIYVALSTLPLLPKGVSENFFKIVLKVSAELVEWQWVLCIGEILSIEDLNNIASNTIIVNNAPHLDLIKKANIVITHGGASTVKECIYFGVSMIVFPLWFDQPGNAARIVYHELGIKGDFEKLTTDRLLNLIGEINSNMKYRNNVKKMQVKFQYLENKMNSVHVIEKLINDHYFS